MRSRICGGLQGAKDFLLDHVPKDVNTLILNIFAY